MAAAPLAIPWTQCKFAKRRIQRRQGNGNLILFQVAKMAGLLRREMNSLSSASYRLLLNADLNMLYEPNSLRNSG